MRNFIITVDGKRYEVGVEEVGADSAAAPVAAKPAASAAPAAPAPAAVKNGKDVLSPFPGLVKNFLVKEGDTVKKDQPILVLEAMKMDSDITAPCDGVISFRVTKGMNVESDAVLAVIG